MTRSLAIRRMRASCPRTPLAPGTPAASARQHLRQVEADRPLELGVRAGGRVAVGTPVAELRGVPEPGALHVVVGHLDDELGPQRHEARVLVAVPPRRLAAGP